MLVIVVIVGASMLTEYTSVAVSRVLATDGLPAGSLTAPAANSMNMLPATFGLLEPGSASGNVLPVPSSATNHVRLDGAVLAVEPDHAVAVMSPEIRSVKPD